MNKKPDYTCQTHWITEFLGLYHYVVSKTLHCASFQSYETLSNFFFQAKVLGKGRANSLIITDFMLNQ